MMVFEDPERVKTSLRQMAKYVDDLYVMNNGDCDDDTWKAICELEEEIPFLRKISWPQNVKYYGSDSLGEGWDEPKRRNFCIEQCKYDNILTLDSDEIICDVDINYFREIDSPLRLQRYNILSPTKYIVAVNGGKWFPDLQLRFFQKEDVRYVNSKLHCFLCHDMGKGKCVDSGIAKCKIWHFRRARIEETEIKSNIEYDILPEQKPEHFLDMITTPR